MLTLLEVVVSCIISDS